MKRADAQTVVASFMLICAVVLELSSIKTPQHVKRTRDLVQAKVSGGCPHKLRGQYNEIMMFVS